MMDTVLNLGLNEHTLHGLIALTGNERFGWDAYRRFIQMFGRIVMGVDAEKFDEALDHAKSIHGAKQDTDLDAAALQHVSEAFKAIVKADTGRDFPSDPFDQLDLADQGRLRRRGSASAPTTTARTRRSATTWARPSTS